MSEERYSREAYERAEREKKRLEHQQLESGGHHPERVLYSSPFLEIVDKAPIESAGSRLADLEGLAKEEAEALNGRYAVLKEKLRAAATELSDFQEIQLGMRQEKRE